MDETSIANDTKSTNDTMIDDADMGQEFADVTDDECDTGKDIADGPPRFKRIVAKHVEYKPDKPEIAIRYHNPDCENTYDMFSFPRGVLVIFNMREFDSSTGLHEYPRKGTDKDADDIKDVFLDLGFVVRRYDNVSRKGLFSALRQVEQKYTTLSCVACVILSHGLDGKVYVRDSEINLNDIFAVFESPNWVGKPKLFFIQACQGDVHMDGITPSDIDSTDGFILLEELMAPLPRQSDFLYAYSTVRGYSSWRNSENGSWFIQELCQSLRTHSHLLDLSRILTRANKQIASRVTYTEQKETNNKRQIASMMNQLRKDLYFFPPNGPIDKKEVLEVVTTV